MQAGSVVDGRFEIVRLAGAGGMARIYHAKDKSGGADVAIKVLIEGIGASDDPKRERATNLAERFVREADVLATLAHPAIVKHVAHGRTKEGELYLAMEWLEGTTLAERLKKGGLTAGESVQLCRRIAEGLGAAHARGVIHRDIKPSNLLLLDGDVERVKILDFGVARIATTGTGPSTKTGMMLGTPGYMAPEQARGHRGIDARADVFSLGCVLFECLAGRPPFLGENFMAVLAKILLEEVPRLAEIRADTPPELDALVQRMLSKEPTQRPTDGHTVARELEAIGEVGGGKPERFNEAPIPSLTGGEQKLLTVIVGGATPEAQAALAIKQAAGQSPISGTALMATIEQPSGTLSELRSTIGRFGGQLERLLDGAVVVTFGARGSATDQVSQAARCAIAMRKYLADVPIALATGRGVVASRFPVGEVIDRAARLLRAARRAADARGIRIDETTAGLLDTRFEVGGDGRSLTLYRERDEDVVVRTLLGKPVPCVGREREIATLIGILDECIEEPVARAVLVTAPPGIGKSRLRAELIQRVQQRTSPRIEIWIARGDPMSAGSPFGLLAQIIRRAAGIAAGEPLDVRRRKLRARIARNVPSSEVARVTEFLGELMGVSFEAGAGELDRLPDSAPSVQLRAARQDPRLMGDQMRRAWEDLVTAECNAQPVLVVLEDLHWGDLPTVQFLDSTLRQAQELPFMVLALARPEVNEVFPQLWQARDVQPLPLRELKRSACEKLAREVLGDAVSAELVANVVERAAGNAFYLEELMRAVAEGRGDALPETVIAMVQARLESLEGEARRVLRAASVFGQVFWGSGVSALLGAGDRTLGMVTEWLEELARREIVTARRETRFPNQREYSFRHALVRETAYGMLTPEDRALGHRLAGAWLESAGESDDLVLAEHFERGGDRDKAIKRWFAAAEQAFEGNDLASALARAERGVASGASGEALGSLRLVQAMAHIYRAEFVEAQPLALDAMALIPHGTPIWFRAAGAVVEAAHRLENEARLLMMSDALLASEPDEKTYRDYAFAAARTVAALVPLTQKEPINALLDRLRSFEDKVATTDPAALAWIKSASSWNAFLLGDVGDCLDFDRVALERFEAIGDIRRACEQRTNVAYDMMTLGAFAEAETALREAIAATDRLGLMSSFAMAKHNLGNLLAERGALAEAAVVEQEAIDTYAAQGDRRMSGYSRIYLARILSMGGDLAGASAELAKATEMLPEKGGYRVHILALESRIALLGGDIPKARERGAAAVRELDVARDAGEGDALAYRVYVEALLAAGATEEAKAAARAGRAQVVERAAKISDPDWRESFLKRVPDHARLIELSDA